MKQEYTKDELKRMWTMLVETFELSEEQLAAIHHQIPMTQELFDSILDKAEDVGPDMDKLFYSMLDEYPEYMSVRADKILEEVEKANLPDLTPEESEKMREGLYAKIRAKYGENAI